MKIYEVVTTKKCDEFLEFIGSSLENAKAVYKDVLKHTSKNDIELRVYNIDDTVNITEEDELLNAIIDCIGYHIIDVEDEKNDKANSKN